MIIQDAAYKILYSGDYLSSRCIQIYRSILYKNQETIIEQLREGVILDESIFSSP